MGWRQREGGFASAPCMSGELPSGIVADIGFIGRGGGLVKALGGFRKGHHQIPDAVNGATSAFFAKICADELAAEAERLFQDVRTGLGYKRKEISLTVASPAASLAAKDFSVEIIYGLEERDPARYAITTTLHGLRNPPLARDEAFSRIFAGKFCEIGFALRKGARVEAVIDAIEDLDAEHGLTADYPSDCRECAIGVAGVDAHVRVTGGSLEIVFPRAGAPAELIEAFAAVRGAFAVSRVLAGLIG